MLLIPRSVRSAMWSFIQSTLHKRPPVYRDHQSLDISPNVPQLKSTVRPLIVNNLGLKKLFVSCNGPKKNRVGRSVKIFFLHYFFGQKCVFNACFMVIRSWKG